MKPYKFMQVLDEPVVRRLRKLGKSRGIPLQQMIRAVIIPEWEAYIMTRESFKKRVRRGIKKG
jgi:hypothetical protein